MCYNVTKSKEIEKDTFKHNLRMLNESIKKGEKKLLKFNKYGVI